MEQNVTPASKTKTSGMAILSLIFSLIPLLGLIGLILGFVSLSAIKKRKQELTGRGLAIAGITIGALNFIIICFMFPIIGHFISSEYDEGMIAYNQKDYITAIGKFKQVTQSSSKYSEAQKMLQTATEEGFTYYLNEAQQQLQGGNCNEAEKQLQNAVALKSGDERVITLSSNIAYKKGLQAYESQNYEKATEEFNKVLKEDSHYKEMNEIANRIPQEAYDHYFSAAKTQLEKNDLKSAADNANKALSYQKSKEAETLLLVIGNKVYENKLEEVKTQTGEEYWVKKASNLVKGPGNNYPLVAQLRWGDKIEVFDGEGDWIIAKTANNKIGYLLNANITQEYKDILATKIKQIALAASASPENRAEVAINDQGEVTIACWYRNIKPGRSDDELLAIAIFYDFGKMAPIIFKNYQEVNYVRYFVCEKLYDDYGVIRDYWVAKIALSREKYKKINWNEEFLSANLPKVADEFEIGCELYEDLTEISTPSTKRSEPSPSTERTEGVERTGKPIKTFTGSADVTTETFSVPTDAWKVTVFVKSDSPKYSSITVYAYADGKNPENDASDADFSMDGIGSQSSYFRTGKGNYFLRVSSANCKWTVTVESGK